MLPSECTVTVACWPYPWFESEYLTAIVHTPRLRHRLAALNERASARNASPRALHFAHTSAQPGSRFASCTGRASSRGKTFCRRQVRAAASMAPSMKNAPWKSPGARMIVFTGVGVIRFFLESLAPGTT